MRFAFIGRDGKRYSGNWATSKLLKLGLGTFKYCLVPLLCRLQNAFEERG